MTNDGAQGAWGRCPHKKEVWKQRFHKKGVEAPPRKKGVGNLPLKMGLGNPSHKEESF